MTIHIRNFHNIFNTIHSVVPTQRNGDERKPGRDFSTSYVTKQGLSWAIKELAIANGQAFSYLALLSRNNSRESLSLARKGVH